MNSARSDVGIRSARRFNPITGEEQVFSARPSRPNSRPECVPPLPLSRPYGKEREDLKYRPQSRRDNSPGSSSTVSWGPETGRSDVSVMKLDSMRTETIRPEGVPPLEVRGRNSAREEIERPDQGNHMKDTSNGRNQGDWSEYNNSSRRNYRGKSSSPQDEDTNSLDDDDDRSTLMSPSEYSPSDSEERRFRPDKDDTYSSSYSSRRYMNRNDDNESCLSYRSTRSDASSIRSERRLTMDANTRQLVMLFERKTGDRTRKTFKRSFERESRNSEMRMSHTLETVMVDQLSRAPLCDPEQSADRHMKEAALRHTPGMARGKIRALHESKIRTSSSMTEHLLSDRIRFNARIITQDGRDALRELCGFYFDVDRSFTVYEYRQLGKTSKALPVLPRSQYLCVWGLRRGDEYSILDLYPGNTLYINAKTVKSLPRTLQSSRVLILRITDVDVEAKKPIIMARFLGKEKSFKRWNEIFPQLHLSKLKEDELQMQLALIEIQDAIRSQLGRRGCPVYGGLYAFFRRRCRQETDAVDGMLPRWTLEEGIRKFRVPLTGDDLDVIWDIVDPQGEGYVDFTTYIRTALGEMNEPRRELVLKSYLKMDFNKRGWIGFPDVGKFYKSGHDPLKLAAFLDAFDFVATKDVITYPEFEIFYEGVSIERPNDEDFLDEMLNTWNL